MEGLKSQTHRKQIMSLYVYDLRWGLIKQWKKYLLICLFCLSACIYLSMQINGINGTNHTDLQGTFIDYLLNFLHGMEKYVPSAQNTFQMPVTYLGFFILISFVIGNYAVNDLGHHGIQTITRGRSRAEWMIGKILWNSTCVLVVYILIVLFAVIFGSNSLVPTEFLCDKVFHFHEVMEFGQHLSGMSLTVTTIGISFLTSLAFAQMQMTIELLISPIVGFLAMVGLAFLSAFITSPLLLGNYWMIQRCSYFLAGGMQIWAGIVMNLTVILLSIAIDLAVIRSKNIL